MRRRSLMHAGAAAMIWPCPAGAQRGPIPRIGCLFTRANYGESFNTLRRGLRDLGYVEGENIILDVRSSDGDNSRLPGLAPNSSALNRRCSLAMAPSRSAL